MFLRFANLALKPRPRALQVCRLSFKSFSSQAAATEEDADVPPAEFQRMKESLNKFSQCMMLGKYSAAQMVLTAHREDVERFFPRDHPAFLSVENN